MDYFFDILNFTYNFNKFFHIISVISWMAGLFYLPRLFVYHVEGLNKKGVKFESDSDLLFQHQEKLLLKAIMNPAMISTWFFGCLLLLTPGIIDWSLLWPWIKILSVILMTWFHIFLGKQRKKFIENNNQFTGYQFRLMNEIPTVLMIIIVISVVFKF